MGMDLQPLLCGEMNSISYYTTFPFTQSADEPDNLGHYTPIVGGTLPIANLPVKSNTPCNYCCLIDAYNTDEAQSSVYKDPP
jgi:hypothetical protein